MSFFEFESAACKNRAAQQTFGPSYFVRALNSKSDKYHVYQPHSHFSKNPVESYLLYIKSTLNCAQKHSNEELLEKKLLHSTFACFAGQPSSMVSVVSHPSIRRDMKDASKPLFAAAATIAAPRRLPRCPRSTLLTAARAAADYWSGFPQAYPSSRQSRPSWEKNQSAWAVQHWEKLFCLTDRSRVEVQYTA